MQVYRQTYLPHLHSVGADSFQLLLQSNWLQLKTSRNLFSCLLPPSPRSCTQACLFLSSICGLPVNLFFSCCPHLCSCRIWTPVLCHSIYPWFSSLEEIRKFGFHERKSNPGMFGTGCYSGEDITKHLPKDDFIYILMTCLFGEASQKDWTTWLWLTWNTHHSLTLVGSLTPPSCSCWNNKTTGLPCQLFPASEHMLCSFSELEPHESNLLFFYFREQNFSKYPPMANTR